MGTNCSTHPRPVYENTCGFGGEKLQIPNYCAGSFSSNESGNEICSRISKEWEFSRWKGSCFYSSCERGLDFGSGCCNGCCGIPGGSGIECQRKSNLLSSRSPGFIGNPFQCCFQDMVCTGEERCWTDSSHNATCPPINRDLASPGCKAQIFNYCSGISVGGPDVNYDQFITRWTGEPDEFEDARYPVTAPCYKAVWRNLYENCLSTPGFGVATGTGFQWTRDLMTNVLNKYVITEQGSLFPGEPGYNPIFVNTMWSICSEQPGLCANALRNICVQQTSATLLRNPGIRQWCGCYMADDEYSKYTNLYGINKECTPMCSTSGVLPLANGTGIQRCTQNVCVIDDLQLSLYGSQINQLGFTQICPACGINSSDSGSTSCQCTISNNTIRIIDSQIPNLNLSNNCGVGSECFQELVDDNGNRTTVRVPCTADASYDPYKYIKDEQNRLDHNALRNWYLAVVLIIAGAILVVIAIFVIFMPAARLISSKYTSNKKT